MLRLFLKKVICILALPMASLCYAAEGNQQLEANKKAVIEFYNLAFNQQNFAAASNYLGEKYIQHSPHVADGREGLKELIETLKTKYPHMHARIIRSFVDNDYVILQVNFVLTPNSRGLAIIDIFKLNDGKIIEHWGVSQEVPEKSKNTNGMF